MSAEAFLDTNIFVYCFDPDHPLKQQRAKELISESDWFVSWQVVQEFASVSLHKFKVPLQKEDLQDYLALRLWPKCRVFPTEAIFAKALSIQEKFGFRFYDSLIVASALAGGAAVLFSEDMQHGQKIGSLQILNPFREIRAQPVSSF